VLLAELINRSGDVFRGVPGAGRFEFPRLEHHLGPVQALLIAVRDHLGGHTAERDTVPGDRDPPIRARGLDEPALPPADVDAEVGVPDSRFDDDRITGAERDRFGHSSNNLLCTGRGFSIPATTWALSRM
jgi:hypothetical protein